MGWRTLARKEHEGSSSHLCWLGEDLGVMISMCDNMVRCSVVLERSYVLRRMSCGCVELLSAKYV